jgi:hypothetical protein
MQQELTEGHLPYQGRSPDPASAGHREKSAEAIVVKGNEPQQICGGLTEVMKG